MRRVLLLLLSTILVGCPDPADYSARPRDPVVLFGRLSSYASEEASKSSLKAPEWNVLETRLLGSGKRAKRYEVKAVSAGAYVHGGFAGELRLEFSNDRLGKVWFAPERPGEYFKWLGMPEPASGAEPTENRSGGVLVQVGRSTEGRAYIFWQEDRLVFEQANYLRKHGE